MAAGFDSPVARGDLATEEGIDAVLGSWVREHTGGLIEESAIDPDPRLRFVLQDAVVLGARWQEPLTDGPDTLDFTSGDGATQQVPAMGGSVPAAHLDADGWTGARLPYQGERLEADVLLPPEGTDPTAVDAADFSAAVDGLDAAEPLYVGLTLPTLELSSTLDATPWLEDRAPVVSQGDGLDGLGGAFIEQVAQQVVLDVDEEGTVAAAVTEVVGAESGPAAPDVVLTVDRPYLLRIGDTETGLTLFLAAVNDPRG